MTYFYFQMDGRDVGCGCCNEWVQALHNTKKRNNFTECESCIDYCGLVQHLHEKHQECVTKVCEKHEDDVKKTLKCIEEKVDKLLNSNDEIERKIDDLIDPLC